MSQAGIPESSPELSPELSVVIPVHNEAENIASLLAEICAALRGRVAFEIVAVDDCSTDATPAILRQTAAAMPELRPIRHRRNAGQSMAVLSGVKAARAPFIATLDGDGQNDPADLPALWQALRAEADGGHNLLIAGHRTRRQDSWVKRYSSRIANRVRSALLKDATPDTGCGLKMLSRALFLSLPAFDHMHRFLPALVLRQGGQVRSVPVNHRPRQGGVSHYGTWGRLKVGLVDLVGVSWLQRRWRDSGGSQDLRGQDLE
ncbi:glycosyltransferase family 2 protein [Ferrovibrio sp.]|uniref:glycosyltransferase family 2 protein n=1 Tax=Ferrovibrio sp. TaxID=1917215 RepID=UPI0025BF9D03|nr:glycosyltransferase family 2 protein [Ferrovibrio sp.]MBX3454455.1 glycosyltransferase family 2 protein [Ferrovibrio sp.]